MPTGTVPDLGPFRLVPVVYARRRTTDEHPVSVWTKRYRGATEVKFLGKTCINAAESRGRLIPQFLIPGPKWGRFFHNCPGLAPPLIVCNGMGTNANSFKSPQERQAFLFQFVGFRIGGSL